MKLALNAADFIEQAEKFVIDEQIYTDSDNIPRSTDNPIDVLSVKQPQDLVNEIKQKLPETVKSISYWLSIQRTPEQYNRILDLLTSLQHNIN